MAIKLDDDAYKALEELKIDMKGVWLDESTWTIRGVTTDGKRVSFSVELLEDLLSLSKAQELPPKKE